MLAITAAALLTVAIRKNRHAEVAPVACRANMRSLPVAAPFFDLKPPNAYSPKKEPHFR